MELGLWVLALALFVVAGVLEGCGSSSSSQAVKPVGGAKTRSYTDNGDGTVTDHVTGLMWQKDMGPMQGWQSALDNVASAATGGHTDWRMPTIKELFSLIMYSGQCKGPDSITMFIDVTYFNQPKGDTTVAGGREIDAQTWSATDYVPLTMGKDDSAFGVNFVDGRVKCYPKVLDGQTHERYARYVRGNKEYGINKFVDNGDDTISDEATGLMWAKKDSGTYDWAGALEYSESLDLAGHSDWRLPTAKELQSIADYSQTKEPMIDRKYFDITKVKDIDGNDWYPYFWSSSTLLDGMTPGDQGVYVPFGRALGVLTIPNTTETVLVDAHGAGAVRCDPKSGNPADYPSHTQGFQGDLQYVYNYVRPVRSINTNVTTGALTYPIVETDITACYNAKESITNCPAAGKAFYGQDASYASVAYQYNTTTTTAGQLHVAASLAPAISV